jgi:hypothetical protein
MPAIPTSEPATTGETVTVACKLPNGLLLRIFEKQKYMEPTQSGAMKETDVWVAIPGRQYAVRGPWAASAGQAYNRNNGAVAELLPGGFGLTHGVPKDIWDEWYAQNKNTALVRKGIIFASPGMQAATIEAKQARAVKSGLEPLDPDRPAERMPGGVDRRLRMSILQEGEAGTSPRG